MQKRLLATLILLAFGLGLAGGPHPCRGQSGEGGRPKAACHGMGSEMAMAGMSMAKGGHAAPGWANLPTQGHRGPASCCDTFCQHACQIPAITAAQPVAFAIEPVALTVVEPPDPGLTLFFHPLDHVPLA